MPKRSGLEMLTLCFYWYITQNRFEKGFEEADAAFRKVLSDEINNLKGGDDQPNYNIIMRKMTQRRGAFHSNPQLKCQESITASKFAKDGSQLALGDTFGRLVLFSPDDNGELQYTCEVKAYNETHDWANMSTMQPSVKCLEWLENGGARKGLLTAGDRDISLWRLTESSGRNVSLSTGLVPQLEQKHTTTTRLTLSKSFAGLHTSPVKGISVSSNQEYLLTFDSNRILKWNLQFSNQPHLIFAGSNTSNLRLKPPAPPADSQSAMIDENDEEELTEFEEHEWADIDLLTAARLQPGYDNKLAYTTKNGDINYVDMRLTNKTSPAVVMAAPAPDQFLKLYLNSISDFCFLDDYQIVTRDYLSVKVWDLRNPTTPKSSISIYSPIVTQLCDLYENGRFSDQFSLTLNATKTKVLTPHYDCSFHEIDLNTKENIRYRVDSATASSWKRVKGDELPSRLADSPRVKSACYDPTTDDIYVTIKNTLFGFSTDNEAIN